MAAFTAGSFKLTEQSAVGAGGAVVAAGVLPDGEETGGLTVFVGVFATVLSPPVQAAQSAAPATMVASVVVRTPLHTTDNPR